MTCFYQSLLSPRCSFISDIIEKNEEETLLVLGIKTETFSLKEFVQ